MPEIKIADEKSLATSILPGGGSAIQKASGTIGDIVSLLAKGEQLASHVENIVGMFKGRENQNSSIIQSKALSPPVTTNTPQAPQVPLAGPAPAVNDKSMEAYFSSPEGLEKIAGAIDKMIPLIGDLKLSEVKQAIENNISSKKKGEKK